MWKIKIFGGPCYVHEQQESKNLEQEINNFIVKNKIENFSLETSQSNFGDYKPYLIIIMKYKVNSKVRKIRYC